MQTTPTSYGPSFSWVSLSRYNCAGVWDDTAYGGNNSADALVGAVPSSQIGLSSVDLTIQ